MIKTKGTKYGVFIASLLVLLIIGVCLGLLYKKENWGAGNWDFMDLPDMCGGCKGGCNRQEEVLENSPHFGGTPNNSQVWF